MKKTLKDFTLHYTEGFRKFENSMNNNWSTLTKTLRDGGMKASKSRTVDNHENSTNAVGKKSSNIVHSKSSNIREK